MSSQPLDKKYSILVIDDEEDIRNLLERRLYGEGYDVAIAANGKHALQKIVSGKKFDLILCDFKMPLMDGSKFIVELRKAGFKAPILVMTGHPEADWISTAAKVGIAGIFVKPFKHQDLLDKIRALLGINGQNLAA